MCNKLIKITALICAILIDVACATYFIVDIISMIKNNIKEPRNKLETPDEEEAEKPELHPEAFMPDWAKDIDFGE